MEVEVICGMELDKIYSRREESYDKNYHLRNFFIHYKDYIDVSMSKKDKDTFKRILDSTQKSLENVDVNKTTIFICEKPINKYLFLSAFAKLPRLVTHRYLNFIQLMDIWNQNANETNQRLENDEIFRTEQDIREDVFCLYIDRTYEGCIPPFQQNVLPSFISSRNNRVNRRREGLITWIFYQGTFAELQASETFKTTLKQFQSDADFFQIIDLNGSNIESVKTVTATTLSGTGINNSIGDIY